MMKVHDLPIPEELVRLIAAGSLARTGSWPLREPFDHFGQPLETELGEVFSSAEAMAAKTRELPREFVADGCYGDPAPDTPDPHALADILDFERIVCFALAGDGSPFCLDYRDRPDCPSVIWWDDTGWRRLAPSPQAFLALFDLAHR